MRPIGATFRSELEDPHNPDPALVFVTITTDDPDNPIRTVWDSGGDYILSGKRYAGFGFQISLLQDSDDPPNGKLSIQNVDFRIGEAIRNLNDPPGVTVEIYPASDFDLTVNPRVPLGTPQLAYRSSHLYFRRLTVDVVTASGDLTSWDYVSQPFPSKFATQALLPGLFR